MLFSKEDKFLITDNIKKGEIFDDINISNICKGPELMDLCFIYSDLINYRKNYYRLYEKLLLSTHGFGYKFFFENDDEYFLNNIISHIYRHRIKDSVDIINACISQVLKINTKHTLYQLISAYKDTVIVREEKLIKSIEAQIREEKIKKLLNEVC